jgi:DNA polymerase
MADTKVVGMRIDIETRSGENIKYGVFRYSEDPDFLNLITRYSLIHEFPGGQRKAGSVRSLDLTNRGTVEGFQKLLVDTGFVKTAFNAQFERVCLSRWMGMPTGTYLDPRNWHCSAVRANVNGIFGSLDEVARALRSPIAKDPIGKSMIKMFSIKMTPRDQKAADKTCGCQRFHDPAKHPAEFKQYGDYCSRDVETEAAIAMLVPDPPDFVQAEYEADQRINDRGIRHFSGLSKAAVKQVDVEKNRLMGELKASTGLVNPNSVQQFRGWLEDQKYPMISLDKLHREEALNDSMIPAHVARALILKGSASLSSVAKHQAALDTRSEDGRIRGSLRFYGAHTGREAGRGIQPQNLPRYEAPAADRRRLLLGKAGQDAPEIAKGTVRASLVPAKGNVFVVVDYNAIEARMLGWLAGEKWVLDEFRTGQGKIYEATAAVMFGANKLHLIDELKLCGKCGHCSACSTRARGKVSNLALGYAGGAGALVTMGAEREGIDIGNYNTLHREWVRVGSPGKFHEWHQDLHDYPVLIGLRDAYRNASPATVGFWKQCAKAWDVAALQRRSVRFGDQLRLSMVRDGRHNRAVLPSGRSIWYRSARAHEEQDRNGNPRVDRRTFMGKSNGIGHSVTDTHGGSLTENLTQAAARDVLFDLIMRVEAMTANGWPGQIVLHVHDEIVVETPEPGAQQIFDDVLGEMQTPPSWGSDLPVAGAGSIMERYGK